jgi:hypothetical protein
MRDRHLKKVVDHPALFGQNRRSADREHATLVRAGHVQQAKHSAEGGIR